MMLAVQNKGARSILLFLLLLSLVVYAFHPDSYSFNYVVVCSLIALGSVICHFKSQQKDNYFDFDTIFLIILFVCCFSYPLFFHGRNIEYNFFTINDYLNEKRISSAVAISAIAFCSYCYGASSIPSIPQLHSSCNLSNAKAFIIPTKTLTIVFALLTLFAIANGSVQYYQDLYHEGIGGAHYSRLVGQVTAITKALYFVLIGTEAYNYYQGKRNINFLFVATTFLDASLMLYAGNRTLASEYFLSFFFFIFYFKRNIRFVELIGMLLVAFAGMYFIQQFRQQVEISSYFGVHILSDFMSPYRMNLLAMDYADRVGYTFGVSLLGPVTGIIPGLSSLLQAIGVDISYLDSASALTTYEQGRIHTSGLGTSLQADAYLAFGVIGVFVFFYYLGKFAKLSFYRLREGSYYYFIIYAILVGHSVYWVRSLVFLFSNLLVWGILIAKFNMRNTKNKF